MHKHVMIVSRAGKEEIIRVGNKADLTQDQDQDL